MNYEIIYSFILSGTSLEVKAQIILVFHFRDEINDKKYNLNFKIFKYQYLFT